VSEEASGMAYAVWERETERQRKRERERERETDKEREREREKERERERESERLRERGGGRKRVRKRQLVFGFFELQICGASRILATTAMYELITHMHEGTCAGYKSFCIRVKHGCTYAGSIECLLGHSMCVCMPPSCEHQLYTKCLKKYISASR
jgi:hypothetical protein